MNSVVSVKKIYYVHLYIFFSRVLLILEMTLIAHGSEVGEKIGSPTQLTDSDTNMTNSTAASASNSNNFSSNISSKPTANGSSLNESMKGPVGDLNVAHTHPISSLSPYHNK